MGKKPQVSALTKEKLKQAFWSLYQERPIETISIKEITDLAGVNRGTFYLYYKDIYDILNQIEENIFPDIHMAFNDVPVLDYIWDAAQAFAANREYLLVLLGPHGDPAFREKLGLGLRAFLEQQLVGLNDEPDLQKRQLLLDFCTGGTLLLLVQWLRCDPPVPLEDLIELVDRILSPYFSDEAKEFLQKNKEKRV